MHKRQEIRKVLGGIRLVLGLEILKKTALKTFYPKENASSMFARDQMTTCSMESGAQSDTQNYHPAVQILSGCTGPLGIFQPVFFWGGGCLFVLQPACSLFLAIHLLSWKKKNTNSKEAIVAFSTSGGDQNRAKHRVNIGVTFCQVGRRRTENGCQCCFLSAGCVTIKKDVGIF